MPPASNVQQPSQQHAAPHQAQHRFSNGQPQHRSSSSRTVNPATGMPERVGSYIIREEIGRGSFATVYRGERVVSSAWIATSSCSTLAGPYAMLTATSPISLITLSVHATVVVDNFNDHVDDMICSHRHPGPYYPTARPPTPQPSWLSRQSCEVS